MTKEKQTCMINKLSKNTFSYISILLFIIGFGTSCSYKVSNNYLKTPERPNGREDVYIINKTEGLDTGYIHRIKSGDRIAVKFLNNYDLTKSTFNADANPTIEAGYVVDNNGYCNMPLIGKVQLSGLTREEASKKLEKLYSSILNNPIIEVAIVSIKVNVFGEVARQGKFLIDRDNLTLLDLLSEAGGLTNKAKKKKVRIIRGDHRNPQVIVADLTQIGILRYPELLIQDNDIVIVEPQNIYRFTEPTTAVGQTLQPLLVMLNTIAILVTISNR